MRGRKPRFCIDNKLTQAAGSRQASEALPPLTCDPETGGDVSGPGVKVKQQQVQRFLVVQSGLGTAGAPLRRRGESGEEAWRTR